MLGYRNLKWKKNKLYQGEVDTKIYYSESKVWPKMYHVHWDFGVPDKTKQVFNKHSTKDNAKKLYLRHVNGDAENEAAEGSGCV